MSAQDKVIGKAFEEFGTMISKSMKGEKLNGTYKAINHIGNNYLGGFEAATRVLGQGQGIGEAITRTFVNNADEVLKEGSKAKAELNYGKIAGSFIGAGAAGRVISGGGLLRDKNGNTNLIGVPFV